MSNPTTNLTSRPSRGEERALIARAQTGDLAARDQLVAANTGLIGMVMQRITFCGPGLDREDLFQEGLLGLYHAIQKFNLEAYTVKLCTYAEGWIRQSIVRAVQGKSFSIRTPHHHFSASVAVLVAEQAWEQQHGQTPTLEELALDMGLAPEELQRRRAIPLFLDSLTESDPDAAEGGQCLSRLPSHEARFEADVERKLWVQQLVAGLDPVHQKTLGARFGLEGQPVQTLQELGDAEGLTKEAIRRREDSALRRLRRRVLTDPNAAVYLEERVT